jgi:non-canonical purine NTP pyrophosphatase (RdgB/HAM1 family)
MSIYFITGNKGKLAEVQGILENVQGLDIDLPEIQSLDGHEIIKAKLEEAKKHQVGEFIVEDTSLYFEGLNGLPGPLIKWFIKTIGNEGLYKIAEAFANNKAIAKTIIGYCNIQGEISFHEGTIRGTIVAPRGEGFGWDPIFQPEGYTKTFGELTAAEKNSFSMRKIALEKVSLALKISSDMKPK